MSDTVIVRFAPDLPADYVPGLRNGMVVRLRDLDLLPHDPRHPAVALPTGVREERWNARFHVYEVRALGGVRSLAPRQPTMQSGMSA